MDHVIVLAGGDGRRLERVARARYGYARPKQYCDFGEGVTLLDRTLARASRLVDPAQIVVVTTADHRAEADECLQDWPGVTRLEQPRNRDTLPGIALPVLSILERDPHASIAILPSDHFISDDEGFVHCVGGALAALPRYPFELLLLGAQVDEAEDGYGWIVPVFARGSWPRVAAFREKPPAEELSALINGGALANTFVMVGGAWIFAQLLFRHSPGWFYAIRDGLKDPDLLAASYDKLPSANFSEGLESARASLRVVPMPQVGWTDIGTPERLERTMRERVAS